MQSLIVSEPGHARWDDIAEPGMPGPDGALVRPVAVCTCDFDVLLARGVAPVPPPAHVGHECVADVLAVGDAVTSVAPGDRVVVPFQISCGRCAPCLRGHTSSCSTVPWLSCYGLGAASGGWGGAVSDIMAVPYADAMLLALPDGVALPDAAAAACNITDAYRCVVPQLAKRPGAPVLITAGGFDSIALYAAGLAVASGAARVDVVGLDDERAAIARRLGARTVEAANQDGYPVTVAAGLTPESLAATINATAADGICTATMMYAAELTGVPLLTMFAKCATLTTGQPHVRGLLEPVLALLAEPHVQLACVIADTLPWDDAPAAFSATAGKRVVLR